MKALLEIEIIGNQIRLGNGQTVSKSYIDGCSVFNSEAAATATADLTLADLSDGEEAVIISGQFEGYRVMKAGSVNLYRQSATGNFAQVPSHVEVSSLSLRRA